MSAENLKTLPHNGEYFAAKKRKFQQVVVFVHHHTGSKKTTLRHVECVNELGYDAVSFDLHFPKSSLKKVEVPLSSDLSFGLKHFWSDQISEILNRISGKKIVFAFSNPCSAAIEALRIRNCYDVSALICDSGPTSQVFLSTMSYLRNSGRFGPLPMQLATSAWISMFWSPRNFDQLQKDLESMPNDFPILSIRGWVDQIIPPQYIDQVFAPHKHLDWRKMNLPEAGHLDGLKRFPEEYSSQLERFLNSIADSI